MIKPVHSSFSIERDFAAPLTLVFGAWTDPTAKAQWFIGPADWSELERTLVPQVGGVDILKGKFEGGPETLYTARYHAVSPEELIVYVYDMHIDGKHLSTSLASAGFHAEGDNTKLIYTEQAIYYDGEDGSASRETGIAAHFQHLTSYLGNIAGEE